MKVSFGLKAHSGWAALIILGENNGALELIDRKRIDLVDEEWAKQPYHAAEQLNAREARTVVARGIKSAQRCAKREIQSALRRVKKFDYQVAGCAVLVGTPMPAWSVAQILAVHFRMHKAEGVLFREVLAEAAESLDIPVLRVQEKELSEEAVRILHQSQEKIATRITAFGKEVAPPWGKDQKDATLAAMLVLSQHTA